MTIPNPNAPPAPAAPAIPTARRNAVKTAIQQAIAVWPATDADGAPIPYIALHDLAVALRAALPAGVTADQLAGAQLAPLLRELGLDPR